MQLVSHEVAGVIEPPGKIWVKQRWINLTCAGIINKQESDDAIILTFISAYESQLGSTCISCFPHEWGWIFDFIVVKDKKQFWDTKGDPKKHCCIKCFKMKPWWLIITITVTNILAALMHKIQTWSRGVNTMQSGYNCKCVLFCWVVEVITMLTCAKVATY